MITTCNHNSNQSIVSVSENRKTFKIKNNSLVVINKVEVDGCYITSGSRCDYLFEIIDDNRIEKVFYVELKGSDIAHAIEQLKSTIAYCKNIHREILSKECHIISSKFPSSGPSSQILKKKFKKENNIQLFIKTRIGEVIV